MLPAFEELANCVARSLINKSQSWLACMLRKVTSCEAKFKMRYKMHSSVVSVRVPCNGVNQEF